MNILNVKHESIFFPSVIALIAIMAFAVVPTGFHASAEEVPSAVTAVTEAALPAPVLSAVRAGDTSITLNWTAIPGVHEYIVYISKPGDAKYRSLTTTSENSYTATELEVNTDYRFVVVISGINGGIRSNAAAASTALPDAAQLDSVQPVAAQPDAAQPPLELEAVRAGDTSIALNWTAIPGAHEYVVYISKPGDKNYHLLTTTSENSYTATKLDKNTSYRFMVMPRDKNAGKRSNTATASTELLAPVLSAVRAGKTSVALNWTAIPGVHEYIVYISKPGDKKYRSLTTTSENSYTATKLEVNTAYRFMVKPRDTNAGKRSGAATATTELLAPVLSAERADDTTITLNWTAIPGAHEYIVYISKPGDKKYRLLTTTSENSYTATELEKNTAYRFMVKPRDTNAGTRSKAAKATTADPTPLWTQLAQDTAAKFVKPGMSQSDMAKAAFDYVINNTVFAKEKSVSLPDGAKPDFVELHALSVLKYGVGECESYAAAYVLLCQAMGIEAKYVFGKTVSVTGGFVEHAWVQAKIDDVWYNIDPQLTDYISKRGVTNYKYFMKTDSVFKWSHRW